MCKEGESPADIEPHLYLPSSLFIQATKTCNAPPHPPHPLSRQPFPHLCVKRPFGDFPSSVLGVSAVVPSVHAGLIDARGRMTRRRDLLASACVSAVSAVVFPSAQVKVQRSSFQPVDWRLTRHG